MGKRRRDRAAPALFPGVLLSTEEDAGRYLHRRIASREFWTIPWCSRNAARLSEMIERRFYPGATPGFELVVLKEEIVGVPAVVFAHKRRLPAAVLNAFMRAQGAVMDGLEAGGDRDIVAPLDPAPRGVTSGRGCLDPASVERAVRFAAWLENHGTEAI